MHITQRFLEEAQLGRLDDILQLLSESAQGKVDTPKMQKDTVKRLEKAEQQLADAQKKREQMQQEKV